MQELKREDFSPYGNVRNCNWCGRRANFGVSFGGNSYEPRCQYHIRTPDILEVVIIPDNIHDD
jgi:hypothetical protein